jgi:hypothetical protein
MRPLKLFIIVIIFSLNVNAQKISPWLFGQNHWIAEGDEGRHGYINMLWPKIGASGIQLVRIGGNHYNDRHHPIFSDPNHETLTAWIDSIRKIGAEPYFQIPTGKGEAFDLTVDEVKDLVRHFKYANGKGIRFYSIANEPQSHGATIEDVSRSVKKLATAMKSVDPTIKIFVFEAGFLTERDHIRIVGGDLDVTGKDENGNWLVDGITFHRYPGSQNRDRVVFGGPFEVRKQIEWLINRMEFANKLHGRTGDARLGWGLTEFNVTASNPNREISGIGNPSFLGGQFFAEIYGLGMEYGAFTMTPWCINETDQTRTDFGFIGGPMDFVPRSSYYHTQMMARNMKGEFLPSTSSNSFVHTVASKSDDQICVMILNRDKFNDFKFDLILNKEGESNKPLFIHADIGLNKVISDSINNQTTKLFVISKTGEILKRYTYGLEQNLKNLPPEVK